MCFVCQIISYFWMLSPVLNFFPCLKTTGPVAIINHKLIRDVSFFTCKWYKCILPNVLFEKTQVVGQCPKWWSCLWKHCNLSVPDSYWKNCEHFGECTEHKDKVLSQHWGFHFIKWNYRTYFLCCWLVCWITHRFKCISK